MFIDYKLADGSYIKVEVDAEVAAVLAEDDRKTANADRRERYHVRYSLDALVYEGMEFASVETPEKIYIQKEYAEEIEKIMKKLSATQRRRIEMKAREMTVREIAAAEGVSVNAVESSILAVRKIFEKHFKKHLYKTLPFSPYSERDNSRKGGEMKCTKDYPST